MANWFTKALDKASWWDRGGEAQRRKEEEERQRQQQQNQQQQSRNTSAPNQSGGLRVTNSRPTQNVSVDGYEPPEPAKPKNIFEDLNKNLMLGNTNNSVDVFKNASKPTVQPRPGDVVRPKLEVTARPQTQRVIAPTTEGLNPEEKAKHTLERELNAGRSFEDIARNNRFDIDAVRDYAKTTRPNYGIAKIEKPTNQGFTDRIRNVFDANTQYNQWERQQGNALPNAEQKNVFMEDPGNLLSQTPVAGYVAKALNTISNQLISIPQAAHGAFLVNKEVSLMRQMEQAQAEGKDATYNMLKAERDAVMLARKEVEANQAAINAGFQKNQGGIFNTGSLYGEEAANKGSTKDLLIDQNLQAAVAGLDAYTLGKGNAIQQAIKTPGYKIGAKVGAKTALNQQKANISKLVAGNYASGDLNARAQGATGWDPVKSGGAINAVAGSVLDIALPLASRFIKNPFKGSAFKAGGNAGVTGALRGAETSAIANSVDDLIEATTTKIPVKQATTIPVKQFKNIAVDGAESLPQSVNVRNMTEPKPLIQEVGGDASVATPNSLVKQFADDAKANAAREAYFQQKRTPSNPDRSIDGVRQRKFSDIAGVSKTDIANERAALDDALDSGDITKTQYASANRELDSIVTSTERATGQNSPFRLDKGEVIKSQDEAVQEYAKMLKELGEGNGVNLIDDGAGGKTRISNNARSPEIKGKRMTKQAWLDEAQRQLETGQAEPGIQKMFDDAADPEVQSKLAQGEQGPNVKPGKQIKVQDIQGIDVKGDTVVPKNTKTAPGKVSVTTKSDPATVKTKAVAEQIPSAIPKVGSTLPDGTKVTKRMVKTARQERKNAKALAKAQGETAEAMEQVNAKNAPNNALDGRQPGLILSDDLKKGKKGIYQVAKKADQTNELGTKSVGQVIDEAETSIKNNGSLTDRDVANVKASLDSGTYKPGTPEYKKLSNLYWGQGTRDGQKLSLRNESIKRTGSAKEVFNRAVSKIVALAEDPTKVTAKHIDDIQKSADKFVETRDALAKASDDFNANPSKENYNRFMDLDKQANKAEKAMAMSQYSAAKSALKGNTNVKLKRLVEDAAEDADLYTMDYVDSALLSSTGTFVRNFVNASLGSVEEGAFGGVGARVARTVKGTPIGGGIGRGSIAGFGKGVSNIVDATKTRFKNAGKNPIEHMKNWSTTGNQLGDSMIEGSTGRSVRNHYEQVLKKQGYKGDELRMRADVMARTDPDNLARDLYAPQARKDAGLGSGISKRSTFEKTAQRAIADGLAGVMGKEYSRGGEVLAKGVTRLVLGYPSAVGRSLLAGAQRVVPLANVDTIKAFTAKDPTMRAAAIKESIKKSGSAATAATIFTAMGANDMVTGAYPKDQNERDRWQREGIKENSIKLGDAWYDIPSYMGSFGLPALVYASIGRNDGINEKSLTDIKSIVGAMSPTDSITDIADMLDGTTDFGKYSQRVVSSAGRMATPYGSLLNQVSKVFDPTQNDTKTDTWTGTTFNKLLDGIPILDRNLPDKTDKEGNTLYNPSVFETMIGSNGAVQKGGEQRSKEINDDINSTLSSIDKHGALEDETLKSVLDGTALEAYNKAKTGKQLDESEIKSLQEGLVKGVSQEGTDTAYLEREQYDTNLAALRLKRDLMESDPTVGPSSMEKIETAIKRGEIYKDNKTPYKDIEQYKDVGVEAWRKMGDESWKEDGDPQPDEYDPEMYEKLWQFDQMMTKAGVSYGKELDKGKYYLKDKKSGSGKGGSGGKGSGKLGSDFGKLKAGSYAPKVQQYATIDQKSGSVPTIQTIRPNIVHKITQSR